MKVGNLRVYRLFCCDIVLGPKPVVGPMCCFVMGGLFTTVLSMMTFAIEPSIWRTIAIISIVVNILIFLRLCFSNPGLPRQIYQA